MKIGSADWEKLFFKRSGICPFVGALILVTLATLARLPFSAALGDASPFLFYWPCVLAVALLFGSRPGLTAVAAAMMLANYLWMPPHRAWGLNRIEFLQLLTFGFGSGSLAFLCEWLHSERQSKEQFRATLANTGEAIITADCAGKILYLNAAAQLLLGWSSEEAIGQSVICGLSLLQFRQHEDGEKLLYQALFEDALLPSQLFLLSRGGRQHLVKLTISRMLNSKRQKIGSVIICRNAEGEHHALLPQQG